jgi:hypothetical protein
MAETLKVHKAQFDAVLQRLIATPPTSMEEAKAVPKVRKDGQLKQKKPGLELR